MFCAEFYGTTQNFFLFLNRAEAFASLRPRNVAERLAENIESDQALSSRVAGYARCNHRFFGLSSRVADKRMVSNPLGGIIPRSGMITKA